MRDLYKFLIALVICILVGIAIGFTYVKSEQKVAQWLFYSSKLYETQNDDIKREFLSSPSVRIQWSELLPDTEKSVLQKYQQSEVTTPTEFTENILRSLEASTDQQYSSAMTSVNTVDIFDNMPVSVAGFIVPIDYHEDKSLRNIFIVPYFGACIHFPPPPPNQIIYAQLSEGFIEFDITQAYQLNGVMQRGLFEDPLGTSAYILQVESIESYYNNPDDFRQH